MDGRRHPVSRRAIPSSGRTTCRREYADFFNDILDFARKLVVPDSSGKRKKRVQYWTALALLRGVMSSPDAGVKMLNTRLDRLARSYADSDATVSEAEPNPKTPSATSITASKATMPPPRSSNKATGPNTSAAN